MSNEKLSAKQEEILDFVKQEILTKGYPPSVREIGEAVNLKSTSSVHAHLESLEKKGYIRKDPTKPRTIEVVDDSFNLLRSEVISLPIIGKVAAGMPLFAEENITGYFPIAAEFIHKGKFFVLAVQGNSMINIGIYDGDYIIVESKNTANNGEVVVALVEDDNSMEPSATVKTFYREDDYIRLQPENDTMEPIIVNDCEIIGKVIGVYRSME